MPRGATGLDALLGYVAGISTFSLRAELATCRVLRGPVAQPAGFPAALARMGAERWRFSVGFTLLHAEMRADRGDVAGAAGQAAKAAIERAHELLCASGNWVLNENGSGSARGSRGCTRCSARARKTWRRCAAGWSSFARRSWPGRRADGSGSHRAEHPR